MSSTHHALSALLVLSLAACSSPKRENPLPEKLHDRAEIPGVPDARIWGDEVPDRYEQWFERTDREIRAENSGIYGREHHYLAISGGGADGAFGAGLLCGWTEAGTRPEFTMVAGISTGALIAPLAFLGPDYDDELREIYTTYSTEDLVLRKSMLKIVTSDAAGDTTPMREKIEKYYDLEMLDRIAAESRRGRALLIGTTNLDARRPVIWDIGRIAESSAPNRVRLFQDVIMASAAIPGAFPPIYFEVEVDGVRYDEMHVDGGATSQVFLYPIGIDWTVITDALKVPGTPQLYTIRNAKLAPEYEVIDPNVLPIAATTIGSLMRTGGYGDMYRIYLAAVRDGLAYHLASIPDDFPIKPTEPFDGEYMNLLFAEAFRMSRDGYPWEETPPGFDTEKE
jgi:hypothetical protein